MPAIKINLEKLNPLPEGIYKVLVKNVKLKESKFGANPYLLWQLAVTEGQEKDKIIFMNTSLSDKALWRIKKLLTALAFPSCDAQIELEPKELINRQLQVKVTTEFFNGNFGNQVTDFYPII